jgi:hypothetical protein
MSERLFEDRDSEDMFGLSVGEVLALLEVRGAGGPISSILRIGVTPLLLVPAIDECRGLGSSTTSSMLLTGDR